MGRFAEIDAGIAPHVYGSTTSLAAAISISGNVTSMHARIIGCLRSNPQGMTDEQMQIALDMLGSTQRPRRGELVKSGTIRDSGRKTKTSSRRSAVVWVLA